LRLRPYRRGDIDRLAALFADPEVTAFTRLGLLTRAQSETTLEGYLAVWRGRNLGVHAALLKSNGEYAGECGLFIPESGGDLALGYAYRRRYWGQGFATEAARAVLDDAFGRLGLKRVLCFVEGTNDASHRVAEKLGFELERIDQIPKGALHAYAMTAAQWASRGYSSSNETAGE